MGNEGSLPTGDDPEGLEYQGRSPPTAILPGDGQYMSGVHNDPRLNGGQNHPPRQGVGRLKHTVFTRRNHAHNQNSTGIERAPQYPPPEAGGSAYPMMPGQELSYSMPQQQQLHSYPNQPQHQYPPPQHHPPPLYEQQQYPQHSHYAQQQQQSYPQQSYPPQIIQGKKPRPGQRAGAAIINSMRNLNISSAMHRIGAGKSPTSSPSRSVGKRYAVQRHKPQTSVNVNEWETRWDEDSDEDDGLNNNNEPKHPSVESAAIPPQARPPDMDTGYMSAVSATDAAGSLMSPSELKAQQAAKATTTVKDDDDERDNEDDGVEWDTGAQLAETEEAKAMDTSTPTVEQFLPLLRVLGKGSFGKVVLVQKRVGREKGSLFAMKILKKSHLVRRRQIERTRTERKVLSAVNHPFIMKLHYAFQTPEKLYLVLDYCPGGELFFHLSRFRRFPERVARFYAAELLLALGHLHKRGIIYRDLKPENVLLDEDGHVKLGDFGLAKAGIRHAYEGATSMCGTPEYMAPEVLAQQGHGFCVDYWGLGMLTYEMMTGLPPWYTTDRTKLFRRLKSAPLDIPPYFSVLSASFTSSLLERNPRRRLGVNGIRTAMEHDFFRSISWRALYGKRVEAPIRPCEGWSPPKEDEQQQQQQQQQPPSQIPTDLDAATANFDNQFTRMPVETDEDGNGNEDDLEELHEDTFVGFTFDDNDRDEIEAAHQLKQQQQQAARPRTQHYSREGHQID